MIRLANIFRRKRPTQPRNKDGRFISPRVEKAREIAVELGRDDLLARLSNG